MEISEHYLGNARFELGRLKRLAEKALDQLPDDEALYRALDEESNSVAVLLQHLSGNLVSRWSDFLTTDGEKPTRDREREFESRSDRSRAELLQAWELGWSRVEATLSSLRGEDLLRKVRIRGEEHTVLEAIQRQIGHTSYHVGQIVFLAKHLSAGSWSTLSIPKGASGKAPGSYKNR